MGISLNITSWQVQKNSTIGNMVFSPDAGQLWELRSLQAVYTSSATVGNRNIEIQLLKGATVYARMVAGIVQAASLTRKYNAAPGLIDLTAFRDTDYLSMSLPYWFIDSSMTIKVVDNKSIDAADTCIAQVQVAVYPLS